MEPEHVAALVLITEPEHVTRIDPALVSRDPGADQDGREPDSSLESRKAGRSVR